MRKINVFDTTLRDGEQSAGVNLNTLEKLEIAAQLERLGVDMIEAGFPASSKGDFESVKKIAETVKGSSVTGLSRTRQTDIDTAWEALKYAEEPRLHIFLATSPIHMTHKLKKTPEQVMEMAIEAVSHASRYFPHVQWSAEDATRSDWQFLVKIIEKVIDAGATVINLPDTVGYTTPDEYGRLFKFIKENVSNIHKVSLSGHCHDDLGMAVANSLAAIEAGADQIEGTINGIGERAGNASLEEIAVALRIRNDYFQTDTGLVLKEINRTSKLVSRLTGLSVPANKAVVGKNAFAHESGIHQDGVLKEKTTYEIITPELVGVASNSLVIGKHSGRHAFSNKVKELGFELTEAQVNEAFQTFKALTDKKKDVTDEDLFAILTEKRTENTDVPKYELRSVQVQYGTNHIPTATVALQTPEGVEKEEAGTGSGSVEAVYNTLARMITGDIKLEDYKLNSIGGGRDALAEAYVKVIFNGKESGGRGSSQDVLDASARAFLNAANRALYNESLQALKEAKV
ncbi:2-isopropylmalate synthase [Pullulanibacillus pueri]|uniref:2-isopropylmalate synthase n=1 Tax=Pullulanibacillus pueri TaxID=1437324 RepID=A0A8J2ZWZ6_9BACL|nr:2-isopropylmalate synthase [Pullulanibacillus pueri]MBM7683566.1 2-isopropylmalate synthase [Pullulanibacillus pueri]GGH84456.1 2-isopropylmalate synthase [Pullulanibacillus pueri]